MQRLYFNDEDELVDEEIVKADPSGHYYIIEVPNETVNGEFN